MKQHQYSLRCSVAIAAGIAVVWFVPMTAAAQAPVADAAPTVSELTPHAADGKPDLTGLWTGNPAGGGGLAIRVIFGTSPMPGVTPRPASQR